MSSRDFAVIGLGRFGASISQTLRALGYDVLGIDRDMARVQAMRSLVTDAVQLDSTDADALRTVNITAYDAVVVAIGVDLESSILTTLVLKELGVKRVLAKAGNTTQQRVLQKVGADVVVFPEEDGGYRLAHSLVYPAINDFIDLGEDYLILDVSVKPEWVGRMIGELGMSAAVSRLNKGAEYVGLQVQLLRRGKRLINLPEPDVRLEAGDVLALVGTHEDLGVLLKKE
jgi:trk system potassium uptake protein TrkA